MNRKTSYLAANLIAPGIGQLLAKKWILGILMLLTGVFSAIWFTWEVMHPIYGNIQNLLNDSEMDLKLFNYRNIILSPSLLVLVWIISYAELFLSKDEGK